MLRSLDHMHMFVYFVQQSVNKTLKLEYAAKVASLPKKSVLQILDQNLLPYGFLGSILEALKMNLIISLVMTVRALDIFKHTRKQGDSISSITSLKSVFQEVQLHCLA